MLSEMAKEDIAYLTGKGVKLSPGQIVRLNDLALLVERGPEAASFVHAPRVAWAGSTPVYEPTIQMHVWFESFARVWWCGNSLTLALAWACAHADRKRFFLRWRDERATRMELERWQRSLDCTFDQLNVALDYALNGAASADDAQSAPDAPPAVDGCPYADIVSDAVAAGLGLSPDELAAHPRRIVAGWLERWLKLTVAAAGGKPSVLDSERATAAYGAYEEYLESIEKEAAADGQG
jgi:hypothetical protein